MRQSKANNYKPIISKTNSVPIHDAPGSCTSSTALSGISTGCEKPPLKL
jgi:hypothetical protein